LWSPLGIIVAVRRLSSLFVDHHRCSSIIIAVLSSLHLCRSYLAIRSRGRPGIVFPDCFVRRGTKISAGAFRRTQRVIAKARPAGLQKWGVDLLDVNPPVLHGLSRVGDFQQLARRLLGDLRIRGQWRISLLFVPLALW
jgi:hypothetical protein